MWHPASVCQEQVLPCRRGGRVAVVLLHGYLCLSSHAYWRGLGSLRRDLAAAGFDVIVAGAPRTGSVVRRAERLARLLGTLPHRQLVLVGHSMGGLDARYVASRLDPARRIRRVITIGTPHRGSAAAELALGRGTWPLPFLRVIDRGALRDLTRDGAHRLERVMPDRPDVAYRALLGWCPPEALPLPLGSLARHVAIEEGDNDGLVSTSSASRWPNPVVLRADHMGLIGQPLCMGITWRGAPNGPAPAPLLRDLIDGPGQAPVAGTA